MTRDGTSPLPSLRLLEELHLAAFVRVFKPGGIRVGLRCDLLRDRAEFLW
jgi:hypothetical protein